MTRAAMVVSAVLAVLFVLASCLVGCWAGASIGSSITADLSLGGGALSTLLLATMSVAATSLKALLPCHSVHFWRASRAGAIITGIMWFTCLAYSWLTVILATLHLTPLASRSVAYTAFASAWLFVELAAGLLPAIAWAAISATPAPADRSPPKVSLFPVPTCSGHVLSLIEHIAGTGRVPPGIEGVRVEPDGCIATSQGALARAVGCSKGTINRQLHQLSQHGQIVLETFAQETRIRIGGARGLAA